MQNFAQRLGQDGNKPNRRSIAANAKVSMTRTGSGEQVAAHHNAARRQGDTHNNAVATPHNAQVHAQHHGTHVITDAYDTDAASLDTSIHHGPGPRIGDSQEVEPGSEWQNGKDEYDGEGYAEVEDFGEGAAGGQSNDGPHQFQVQPIDHQRLLAEHAMPGLSPTEYQDIMSRMNSNAPPVNRDTFGGEDSYPTTTSGPGSYNSDDQDQGNISPSPQKPTTVNTHAGQPAAGYSVQRSLSASGVAPVMHNKSNLFQQGAAIRGNDRSGANLDVAPAQNFQRPAGDAHGTQPPSYMQGNRHHIPAVTAPANVNHHLQNNHALPRRGAGTQFPPSTARPQATNTRDSFRPIANPAPTQIPVGIKPPSPQPTEEETSGSIGPSVDYDLPDLFNMPYDNLKNEDFDTVPRAPAPVLSGDMQEKPLFERLEYVQKSLDSADQAKFFSSLPTAEWEEAGDWFLEKFGSIIKRTQEARQSKRKLARGFEAEVEKRDKHVAKKRIQVEDALQKMSDQGRGLIPKSPGRGSRSPKQTATR